MRTITTDHLYIEPGTGNQHMATVVREPNGDLQIVIEIDVLGDIISTQSISVPADLWRDIVQEHQPRPDVMPLTPLYALREARA